MKSSYGEPTLFALKETKRHMDVMSGEVPEVKPVVTPDMPEVQTAAQNEVERIKKKKGYKSTILTSPMGLGDNAITTKATLG